MEKKRISLETRKTNNLFTDVKLENDMKLIIKIKSFLEKRATKKEAVKRIAEYQKIGAAHMTQYNKEYAQDVLSSQG